MNRAYSLLEIKAVDEEKRVLEGIASTPTPDRMDDIVEPDGAEFKLPIPLLWQHNHNQPIGEVFEAKVTKSGIRIRARIAKSDEPGALRDRLEEAWQSIKIGLVRGLSIGFKSIEQAEITGTWGYRIMRWLWLELSAVTIPANAEATITAVKQFDERARAATGKKRVVRLDSPGASGSRNNGNPSKKGDMTTAEKIAAMEAKLASHLERMNAIEEKASEDGRVTLDESEQEEFDTLHAEREEFKSALQRARLLAKENEQKAKPVETKDSKVTTGQKASDARSPVVRVEHEEKLDPGIEFARFAMCLAASEGDVSKALNLAQTHYPKQVRAINVLKAVHSRGGRVGKTLAGMMEHKTAIPAGTTSDSTWAAPLVEYNQFAGDFVEYLRPRTLIGRFGRDGIPALRMIPFNVHIRGQTSGGTAAWVGQGKPKPVTKFDFNDTYHGFFKIACISVLTEELIRFSDPSAEALVRDGIAGAVIEKMDGDFIDRSVAAVANVSPASITNGLTPIASTGTDADAVRADLQLLWADALAANLPLTSAVYITTPAIALALSLLTNAFGQPEFPGMTMNGGSLLGVPVLVSNHVPIGHFILAFASEIYLSDDGQVTIDASREASIEMLDNPTNATSATVTPTTMVSMFQTNSVALRAERFLNWSRRRTSAVRLLDGVAWNGALLS